MKQKITFLTTCLITLLSITFGFAQNLIVNGNFEAGNVNDGWGNSSTGVEYSYNTAIASAGQVYSGFGYTLTATHGGTFAGHVKTGGSALRQVVPVTEGSTYVVQFWFTGTKLNTATSAVITDLTGGTENGNLPLTPIVADNGANALNNTDYGCEILDNSGSASSWQEAKFSFTIPAASGITQVRFTYFLPNGNQFHFLDDVSVVEDNSLSVDDLVKYDFKSFPNPAKDFVTISASKNINKFEIYNLVGQQVLNRRIDRSNTQVNVSSLSKGIYVMRVFIEDAVGSFKIIKD
ncbi:T9SS type A sorting domain-containing protein [Gaetbulibacter aestuarii]|uniref:T9SS type A sorting domain-containing protein n=1 Tax=Gaetbulibacter aestuarii TaxID=1502358 RepID=A0ABW7N1I5_9FLAO